MGRFAHGDIVQKVDDFVSSTFLELREQCAVTKNVVDQDLLRQLLRSITSIGANLAEADLAVSATDCKRILHIVLREANETKYRLLLLRKTNVYTIHEKRLVDVDEIMKIVSTIAKNIQK